MGSHRLVLPSAPLDHHNTKLLHVAFIRTPWRSPMKMFTLGGGKCLQRWIFNFISRPQRSSFNKMDPPLSDTCPSVPWVACTFQVARDTRSPPYAAAVIKPRAPGRCVRLDPVPEYAPRTLAVTAVHKPKCISLVDFISSSKSSAGKSFAYGW